MGLSRLLLNLAVAMLAVVLFVAVDSGRAQAEEALASWYGPGFEGNPTASGEPYDPYGYTAAHKTLPLGTELTVNYGGSSVQVTVNDRGPYVGDRTLDLSQGAAEAIGLTQAGVDYVEYTYAGAPAIEEPIAEVPVVEEPVAYEVAPEAELGYSAESGYVEEASYQPEYEVGGTGGAYVVQGGDTLTDVASQLGTTTDALAAANGVSDPNYIQAGQTLVY